VKGDQLPAQEIPVPEAIRRIANSEDRTLAWTFFVFFSRMEYALKRSGTYLKAGTSDAQPNWDKFAADYNNQFCPDASPELTAAVDYFLANPPRKQLNNDGAVGWSDPQRHDGREPLLVWLLRMLRHVRNNLFHGGKFPSIRIDEPGRDRELLMNSIVILNACIQLNAAVREFFDDNEG
jgi:hypothetical protein